VFDLIIEPLVISKVCHTETKVKVQPVYSAAHLCYTICLKMSGYTRVCQLKTLNMFYLVICWTQIVHN